MEGSITMQSPKPVIFKAIAKMVNALGGNKTIANKADEASQILRNSLEIVEDPFSDQTDFIWAVEALSNYNVILNPAAEQRLEIIRGSLFNKANQLEA